jgi:predicted GH43/DUF377 family glycosyl hydrolase
MTRPIKAALGLVLAWVLSGCSHYAHFTLPQLAGNDPDLSFTFDEQPQPLISAPGDALNPSVTYLGSRQVMLYSLFDGVWRTATETGVVLSPDAHTWEGGYIAANGAALGSPREIQYWYVAGGRNSGRIGLATSADGQTFTKRPEPVLGTGPFDSWDERAVADPDVVRIDGVLYMYYLGQDRAQPPQQRLGVARSEDGVHWTKLASNPVLSAGPPGSFDEAGVGESAVFRYRAYYWMLYTGRDFTERRRLGLARSVDGIRWEKLPSVFSGASVWDSKVICDPTVLVEGDTVRVWFGGGDVASPDENLHGKIGYGTLHPIRAPKHPTHQ